MTTGLFSKLNHDRRKLKKQIELGLCHFKNCKNKPMKDHVCCEYHVKRKREQERKRRERLKKNG